MTINDMVSGDQKLAEIERASPTVRTVTDRDFEEQVFRSDLARIVVVEFFVPGCKHCLPTAKLLELLAQKGMEIVKLNCEHQGSLETARRFAVPGFPSLYLFRGGKLRSIFEGDRSVRSLEKWVADHDPSADYALQNPIDTPSGTPEICDPTTGVCMVD